MLDFIKIRLPGLNRITDKFQQKEKRNSAISAVVMGILFALAFCPYSGILYFGMLIPMTISSTSGLILPLIFAIATGLARNHFRLFNSLYFVGCRQTIQQIKSL